MGASGLLSSRMARVLTSMNKYNACLVLINQTREKINSFGFGDKTTTPGGKAPRFYSGQSIKMTTISRKKEKR